MAEPRVLRVTRYRCPFDTRSWSKREPAQAHIDRCWNNPETHSCKTCAHHQPYYYNAAAYVPGVDRACLEQEEACLHPDGPDPFLTLRMDCPLWAPKESTAS